MRAFLFIMMFPLTALAQDWGRYQNFVQPPSLFEIQVIRIPQYSIQVITQPPPGSTQNRLDPKGPKPGEPGFVFPMPPGVGVNPKK